MSVKNNLRSQHIGCGLPGFDVAHYGIARRGGVVAHDYCVAYRNVSADELLIAIVDGSVGNPKADGTFNALKIGMITPIGAREILPCGGWKEFLLNATPLEAPVTESGTGNSVATITMTGAAATYYVVEILSDVVCTLACPGATTPILVTQNPGLLATGAIPIGRTAFLIYNTANAERTMTLTNAAAASTGIVTADVKVHAVTAWTLRKLYAIM